MNKTFTMILIVVVIFSFGNGCTAKQNNSFVIKTGNKPSQLGFKIGEGEVRDKGPIAITLYKDKIFILGQVNSKINVYTLRGKYIKTIKLPKNLFYYDLSVTLQGDIIVVTDDGIKKVLKDNNLKEICTLPNFIKTPYQFSMDREDKFVISGLSNQGRLHTGIWKSKKGWEQLEGFRVVTSNTGIIGLQISPNTFKIFKEKKEITISLPDKAVPFGITNNSNIYCIRPSDEDSIEICKINESGIVNSKKVNYNGRLIEAPISLIKFFKVNKNNEIIALEVNPQKIKIKIIKF